jgi:polyphosphate kinase
MMHRNLDRRVEALVSLADPRHVEDMRALLERGMSGRYSHWELQPDGRWVRHHQGEDAAQLEDLQASLIQMHARRRRRARRR